MIGIKFIARQLREPSGLFGRKVMARMLNKSNARINKLAVDFLAPQPEDQVLDIGFGGGTGLQDLMQRVNKGVVHGAEISVAMLRQARVHFAAELNKGRLKLHEAHVEALPFGPRTLNGICSVNTIYFWPSAQNGMREISRILAPGGAVVIGMRSAESMRDHPVTQYGFSFYTAEEVGDLMHHCGLTDIDILHLDKDARFDSLLVRGVQPS